MASILKQNITERMEAKNLSIAELERRAGLSIHSVRNILKGRIKKPSAQSLQAIAEALECSILDLMNAAPDNANNFHYAALVTSKKSPPMDQPELILDGTKALLDLLKERDCQLTLDQFLGLLSKIYLYSSKADSKEVDLRFAEWLVETHLEGGAR